VYRAVRYAMARRVFSQAQHLTAVSPYLASALQRYTRQTIQVVPNPVATGVQERMRVRGSPTRRRVALVVNGWGDLKNGARGLQACAVFAAGETDAEFHLYGHDFGPGQLAQAWATSEGLQARFVFHGPVPHAQLLDELAGMDVLLHPALEESFGVVLAEAMGMGLNVVGGAPSAPGPGEPGPGRAGGAAPGILVDVRSVTAMADGLRRAFDPGYGERSALGVARVSSSFSARSVALAYVSHYAVLLGGADARLHAPAVGGHS
jgi:glycosyltransferase involved in cell wall biosynthesis